MLGNKQLNYVGHCKKFLFLILNYHRLSGWVCCRWQEGGGGREVVVAYWRKKLVDRKTESDEGGLLSSLKWPFLSQFWPGKAKGGKHILLLLDKLLCQQQQQQHHQQLLLVHPNKWVYRALLMWIHNLNVNWTANWIGSLCLCLCWCWCWLLSTHEGRKHTNKCEWMDGCRRTCCRLFRRTAIQYNRFTWVYLCSLLHAWLHWYANGWQ